VLRVCDKVDFASLIHLYTLERAIGDRDRDYKRGEKEKKKTLNSGRIEDIIYGYELAL